MAHPSPVLRRALALAALSLVVAAAPAQAKVTRSTVTAPSDPTYRLYELEPTLADPTLTVAATTDGVAGDKVDVICTFGTDSSLLLKGVPVGPAGAVEMEVPLATFPAELCDVRVVPAGFDRPDFTAYTGPAVAVSAYVPDRFSVPVRGSARIARLDYFVGTGHQRATVSLASSGDGSLFAAIGARADTHEPFAVSTWRGGAGIHEVEIDGRRAFVAGRIPLFDFGTAQDWAPAGFEGLQSSVALDAATGALTVEESERIFRCPGEARDRPDEETCGTVVDTGVRLERTVLLTREHSVTDVRDRWVSADGQAHAVRALYAVDVEAAKAEAPVWRFPGDADFRPVATGDMVPHGPGTVLVRQAADLLAPGAFSFAPAPERFSFDEGGTLSELVQLAVPASGAAALRRVFAVGRDAGEAAALGRATEDGFEAPSVVIADASAQGARATISGRATDNIGVAALSVGGRATAIAADGTFSVPVPLAVGPNEIAVSATDGAGLTATARVTVQRAAVARCRVPKVKAGRRVRVARAALRKAGCRSRTRRVRSRSVRKGRVIGLNRRAGRRLPFGTAVVIRVSAGRRR
jgi:hypothetical protein